jgi:hypothetical protein
MYGTMGRPGLGTAVSYTGGVGRYVSCIVCMYIAEIETDTLR